MIGQWLPTAGSRAIYLEENANDTSGNGYNLTDHSGPTYAIGKFGNAAHYAAYPDGYQYVASDLGVDLTTKIYGMSFWFRLASAPPAGYGYQFVKWQHQTTGMPYNARFCRVTYARPSSDLQIQIEASNNGVLANFTATLNKWYKIDVSADGTNAKLYINGKLYLTAAIGTSTYLYPSGMYLSSDVSSEALDGYIDQVVFFDYDRTASQIKHRYAFETGRFL